MATSTDDKYSHIDEKDKQSVVEKVVVARQWLADLLIRQEERAKDKVRAHAPPSLPNAY
jgi:heat shock 70kDa protein 4